MLALTGWGCSKSGGNAGGGASAATEAEAPVDYAALDKELEAELKESSAEAKAWLSVKTNVLFEGSKAEAVQLTEAFYRAGCPKVYITGIEKLGGVFVSASMVVQLPSEAAARKAAFAIEKTFAAKEGEDGADDKGQKYLSLTFD
jgi:hypothetical protein